MQRNRKRLIIGILIVAALVIVLGTIAAWRHTTALEEILEYAWDGETEFVLDAGYAFTEESVLPIPVTVDIDFAEEELRGILSDAQLWRTTEPDEDGPFHIFGKFHFRLDFSSGDEGYSLRVFDDCVTFIQIEYVDGQEVGREVRYFWDNGNLLQLLTEQYDDAVQEAMDEWERIENG